MTLHIDTYVRKPFQVEACIANDDNLELIAEWCGGTVETVRKGNGNRDERYVEVPVRNPMSDKQKKAFPGDYVLTTPSGFKVFNPRAFANSFDRKRGVQGKTFESKPPNEQVKEGVAKLAAAFNSGKGKNDEKE